MSKEKEEIYEFGNFRLNLAEHTLRDVQAGRGIALGEKAFQTLVALVINNGHLMTKKELLDLVWPDSFVEENNLDKSIHLVRTALGEKPGGPKYVETVRKHGYRFVADVRRLEHGGETHSRVTYSIPSLTSGVLGAAFPDAQQRRPRTAFDAYQQSRIKYQQMTAPASIEARALVEQSLELNPEFTLAHSLSAELTTLEVIVGLKRPSEGFAEAKASIAKARELGADSAEFHSAEAYVKLIADWDFEGAEKSLKEALLKNPRFAEAERMLAEVYMFQGFHDAAAAHIGRMDLETSLHSMNILAISRFLARDYPAVLKACEKMLFLAPGHLIPSWTRCWALEQMGRLDEAIATYEELLKVPTNEPVLRWSGYAYALAGDREMALDIASRLEAAAREHNISPTHRAAIFGALGDLEKAADCIEEGLAMGEPFMLWIVADPRFDILRGNSRFDKSVAAVLEKGTQRPDERVLSARKDGRLPLSRITESGQHLLVDLAHLYDLVDQAEGQSKGSETPKTTAVTEDRTSKTVESPIGWIPLVALIMILLIGGFLGAKLWQTEGGPAPLPMTQRRLTVEGGVTRVAMSRDGRYAAAAQNAALVVFDLENGTSRILIPAVKDVRIMSIAFRPDGSGLLFGTRNVDQSLVTIRGVPLTGGEPVKILDDIYGAPTFSPDGKRIAFVRRYAELNEYALLTANADGSNLNKLASSRLPGRFDAPPAWSPNGRWITCSMVSMENGFHFTIAKIDTASGAVEFVPNQRWKSIGAISWLDDSRRIIIAGQDESSVNAQVWQADTETGALARITNDSFVYESLSGSSDGRAIVAVKVRQNSHVWMLGDQASQLTAGSDNYDGFNGLEWSKDGNIFYHSRAMGHDAIWRMNPDGREAVEITTDAGGGFAVSPNGRFLAFQKKQSDDHLGLQLMDLETNSARPLTENITAVSPSFYPDGSSVVFAQYSDKLSIYKVAAGGGAPQLVSDEFRAATSPQVSPSGRFIAFGFNRVESGNLQSGVAIIAHPNQLVSSHVTKITLGSPYEKSTIRWSADETEVYFIQLENSVSNIMRLKLADGTVSNLTNFAEGRIFNFAIEPGGKRILVARGFVERDAMLFRVEAGN